ncbi:hypothetical protein F53441_11631 [Fusarium austroafricanum]|uniref:Uncharacterized protein n=1 Tax=Fusarium austroafricanum TaxID=2364996 RepID=A0A8H4K3E7_9HYPO|nr:hypothetical protein F53441_11631 [Fusarium austroafricanum]
MPTATEYFGITATNLGPLTTTYTPPAACVTATTDHLVYGLKNSLGYAFGVPKCGLDPYGECLPSGSAIDVIASNYKSRKSGQGTDPYHPPGLYCPHGWTTAGVLAHGDKTGSEVRSGVFTSTTRYNLTEPMASYSDACYHQVPNSAIVTVHTVEGERVSDKNGIISERPYTDFTESTVAMTEKWADPTMIASMVLARQLPVVELVYKAEDVEAAKNDSKSKDDKSDGKSEGSGNAASALSRIGGVAPVVAVVAGLLTGAGLLMPW